MNKGGPFSKLPSTFHFVSYSSFRDSPLRPLFRSLVLLLLLFEQLVYLPLGHGGVLRDDAVLVEAGQQQQEVHCRGEKTQT